jgi:hypothetical protein
MTSGQAFYCTNEKGKSEKDFFFFVITDHTLVTHRPVTAKNTGKYDSIGEKNGKKQVYL